MNTIDDLATEVDALVTKYREAGLTPGDVMQVLIFFTALTGLNCRTVERDQFVNDMSGLLGAAFDECVTQTSAGGMIQ